MSTRRFAAYFFAISAGSTVAFASSLMGRPVPQETAMTEAGMAEAKMMGPGMTLTPTDLGLDALPPATTRLVQKSGSRHPDKPDFKTAQVARVNNETR